MTLPDPSLQDLYNLVADTFHLTITDSIGCTFDTVFEILQPNELEVQETIPRINTWEVACAGDSTGEITLTPLGGANALQNTYLWSTSGGGYISDPASMNQTNLPAGNYTVLVTDINECFYEMTYEMLEPDPMIIETLVADSAYCAGTASGSIEMEASGGVDPFVYLWGGPDGYSATTEDLENLYSGVYYITITDDNLCIKDSLIEVFEADHFDVELVVASDYNGATISCDGYSDGWLTLTPIGGTGPYSYAWSTGATTPELLGLPAGSYSVIIQDFHGCIDSARVVLDDPEPIEYEMYPDDPACYGDATGQIEFLVTGGTVYSADDYEVWLNDMVSGTVAGNLTAGVYQIRIEDLNDCFVETEVELFNNDLLELSFDTEDAFCKDKADGQMDLYVDGGVYPYDVSWSGGLPDNENSFNELYPGEYVATVTDAVLCVTIDTVVVGYTYVSCLVIPNAFSPNGDGFNDLWIIEGLELYANPEIRLFDRWGSRIYYSRNPVDDPWDGTFDGRRLPIDSYHYIIDLNNDDPPITGNITIVR
jgi:gliding motility-associated-like protein